ncbi:MAG: methyl-accepting chemotaxis protein [Planctomycetaceae bacterium]|nr:methyl-accepting chemotaxis protein [Planctomycetaceae bacterium]
MLNQFKIGPKLFGGFAIVLLLLTAVWGTGWYATSRVVKMTEEVDTANVLSQKGLKMQKEIDAALFAAANEALYKDQKYADQVQDIVVNLKQEFGNMGTDIASEKIQTVFKEVMERIDLFAASDAMYWQDELERQKEDDKRRNSLGGTLESVRDLINHVRQVTKEDFSVVQDDRQYLDADRVQLLGATRNIELYVRDINDHVRDANDLSLEYGRTHEGGKREAIRKDIDKIYDLILVAIAEVTPRLVAQESQDALEAFKKNKIAWWKSLNREIELADELLEIDEKTTKIAEEMMERIDTMLGYFEEQANTALKAAETTGTNMQRLLMAISISAIIIGLILCFVLSHDIGGGARAAAAGITHIAATGDINFEVPPQYLARSDEVGDLARCVEELLEAQRSVAVVARALADGDWRSVVKIRGDLDAMNKDLSVMLDQVNRTLHEIDDNVKAVATGSGEVSSAAQSLADGAQEAAASLEEITASMNEISSQTKKNAESAGQARDLAQKASTAATAGQKAMQEMTGAMGQITHNSNEIQRVIKVIDDIAFQTNLLALNAAVEAARAGQHGKGFAVVAEEVRNLASRSAKAAQETSELIAKSGHEIEKGAEVAAHTADVLNTIVEQIKQTTDLVAGIATASNEQAQSVNQVTIGLQQIDSVTQQNTASAEESASAANEMSSMAANLQKLVTQFKLR